MDRHSKSLLTVLLMGLISLLGFHSCSTPEEFTTDPNAPTDSIGEVRLMYGVPTRSYQPGK